MSRLTGAALVMTLLAACGARSPLTDAEASVDGSSDSGVDSGSDSGVVLDAGAGIVFRLSFQSDVPGEESLYFQLARSPGLEGPPWLTLRDGAGTSLTLFPSCFICECDVCTGCPICGPGLDEVREIPEGGSFELPWDGMVHARSTCGGTACNAAPMPLPPGSYQAEMCYLVAAPGLDLSPSIEGMTRCDIVDFTYPPPGGVVENAVCYCG